MENKTSYSLQDALDETERTRLYGRDIAGNWPDDYYWAAMELYKEKATEELRKQNEQLTSIISEALSSSERKNEEIERLTQSNKELVEALDHLTSNNGLLKCVYDGGEKSLLYESYTNVRMLITKSKP